MTEILVILLIIAAVIVLVALVKALKKTDAPPMPKPTSITTTTKTTSVAASNTPKLISTVGPKHSPQITVYANPAHPNAFRCPVCDSKPAPAARYCQVCGQTFQMKGVN